MLHRLLTPRWLGALLLAIVYAVAAYHLGGWQYGRHTAKVERNERITAHYTAAPVPVESVLTPAPMPLAAEWTKVTAHGTFEPQTLVARGRTLDGDVGYEVLAPLRLDSGAVVLVDRGWIPLGEQGAADIPAYAPVATGPVSVTGWVRPGEKSRDKASTPGQIASISLDDAASALHTPLLGGYLLVAEDVADPTSSAQGPRPLGRPDRSLGAHQAYAYQWWMTVPLGFVLIFFGLRREGRASDEDAPAPPKKPKKTRIWDEEDA